MAGSGLAGRGGAYKRDGDVSDELADDSFEDANTAERRLKLQWLALGILLGSIESRKRVDPADFSLRVLECACSELQRANGKSTFTYLKECLDQCGVVWSVENGPPVAAVLHKLALDGAVARAFHRLNGLLETDPWSSAENEKQFLKGLREMLEDLHDVEGGSASAAEGPVTE